MIHFEMAAIQSLQHHFPQAEIQGCLFYFGQCLCRNVQRLGLQGWYKDDANNALANYQVFSSTCICTTKSGDRSFPRTDGISWWRNRWTSVRFSVLFWSHLDWCGSTWSSTPSSVRHLSMECKQSRWARSSPNKQLHWRMASFVWSSCCNHPPDDPSIVHEASERTSQQRTSPRASTSLNSSGTTKEEAPGD